MADLVMDDTLGPPGSPVSATDPTTGVPGPPGMDAPDGPLGHRMKYLVTVERTELIEFEVEAASRQDAEVNVLMDGNETASKTTNLAVVNVEETP